MHLGLRTLLLTLLLWSAPTLGQTDPKTSSRLLFLAAEKALDKGDEQTYTLIRNQLEGYPLLPYLDYQRLKVAIRQSSEGKQKPLSLKQLEQAQNLFQDIPLWNFLLYRWLQVEAKDERWDLFNQGYGLRKNAFTSTKILCQAQYAAFKASSDPSYLSSGLHLWLVGHSQPKSCDPLFEAMEKHRLIKPDHVAQRFYLSIENKKYGLSKYLLSLAPKQEQKAFKIWLKVAKKPWLLKQRSTLKTIAQSQYRQKIIASIFYRYARKDAVAAMNTFEALESELKLSQATTASIVQDIAIRLSHLKHQSALSWLEKIPQNYLDPVANEWKIRLNLRAQNWPQVIKVIDESDPLVAFKTSWQYWKARAHLALNQGQQGLQLLNRIAQKRDYYGFLASEHLKQPIPLQHQPITLNPATLKSMATHSVYARCDELMALRRVLSAKREWFHYLKSLNEEQKLHAAMIAHQKGWHDLSIFTLAKVQNQNDLSLRFPMAFKPIIEKYAQKHTLDSAWVFALTRQESAFSSKVRSPVGATGLMQLMPSTAKYIAKKNQLPKPSIQALMLPERNIELGTLYLGALNNSFEGQLVLATASYNAGINRIIQWLPESAQDSDIWIENIPYRETRHYVKNILTYMGIYKSMLGEDFRITSYLQPIVPIDTISPP